MTNNALTLIWNGNKVPDELVAEIVEVLTTNGICIPEEIIAVYKDQEALARMLIQDTMLHDPVVQHKVLDEDYEAIKNAVIYIGTRFKNELKTEKDLAPFASELILAYYKAKYTKTNDELVSAIHILSTKKGVIPKNLAKRYNFTEEVVNIIKSTYKRIIN